jgi:hypothetical protein
MIQDLLSGPVVGRGHEDEARPSVDVQPPPPLAALSPQQLEGPEHPAPASADGGAVDVPQQAKSKKKTKFVKLDMRSPAPPVSSPPVSLGKKPPNAVPSASGSPPALSFATITKVSAVA